MIKCSKLFVRKAANHIMLLNNVVEYIADK